MTTSTETKFRERILRFLDDYLPEGWAGIGRLSGKDRERFLSDWREALRESGLLAPTWPVEYGGAGLGIAEHAVLFTEVFRRGLPLWGDTDFVGISLLGHALLTYGTPQQRDRFLPTILSGEDVWCQGFSEPGAGSDLASLTTRASLVNDHWSISGQKVWSSSATRSNWICLLARTEPDAGHRGISMLLVPMDQPGVEVRPIKNIRGDEEFCEVFFEEATTNADLVLGGRGRGWEVAMSLLGYERGETVLFVPAQFGEELARLDELAVSTGALDHATLRSRLAWCHMRVAQLAAMGERARERMAQGESPGPEAGGFKVLYSEYHQEATRLALDMLGPGAMSETGRGSASWLRSDDPFSPNTPRGWLDVYMNALAGSIYAGTNQIQRNIVGEMVLGLPREPRPASGVQPERRKESG
jgi:alkylation response protein AidB-like acyl-CoA dehydrogenase